MADENKRKDDIALIESLWIAMSRGEAMTSEDREHIVRMLDDKQLEEEFEASYRSFMSEPRDRARDIADGQESFGRLKVKYGVVQKDTGMDAGTSSPKMVKTANPDRKRASAVRPLFGRIALRAAAVLVPLLIVGGVALFFNNGDNASPVVAELIEDNTGNIPAPEQTVYQEPEAPQPESPAVSVPQEAPAPHVAAAAPIPADPVKDDVAEEIAEEIEYAAIRERSEGSEREVTLPDGSTVRLRRNSAIAYASNFSDNRKVELSGDAFFSVAKRDGQPFEVLYNDMTVRVLGTEFLLNTTQACSMVTLKSGAVEVASATRSVKLTPNQRLSAAPGAGNFSVEELPAADMESILCGELLLRGEPLAGALVKIGRFFGAGIDAEGLPAGSVTIDINACDRLDDVLFTVQQTFGGGFDYRIEGSKVVVRGME